MKAGHFACRSVAWQPALYPAAVIFCNTGVRNAKPPQTRWQQVDLLKAGFQVGKAKKESSENRIIALNQAALGGFQEWKNRWRGVKPNDSIRPSAAGCSAGKHET